MNPMAALKQYMQDHGIKAKDLAQRLGITEGAVSQVMKSKNPGWKTLCRMAEVLGAKLKIEVV